MLLSFTFLRARCSPNVSFLFYLLETTLFPYNTCIFTNIPNIKDFSIFSVTDKNIRWFSRFEKAWKQKINNEAEEQTVREEILPTSSTLFKISQFRDNLRKTEAAIGFSKNVKFFRKIFNKVCQKPVSVKIFLLSTIRTYSPYSVRIPRYV